MAGERAHVAEPAAPLDRQSPVGADEEHGTPDDEATLVIALDMALSGTPREKTAAYLRETFGVDRDDILDEAYGKAGAEQPPQSPASPQ